MESALFAQSEVMNLIEMERYAIFQSVCAKAEFHSMQGFWKHVHEDHNMWNYLYFVLYLDTIPENDHNALESYVYKLVSEIYSLYIPA